MKKRFLPFSLLLVIMILGQAVIADQGGHYVPRTQPTMNAESFMGSLRANQQTGLIDPADMLKAMQAPATRGTADNPLYWISMGPDNMGGQTTAILYDNKKNPYGNPNGVVYIGSKGGGVYKTYNHGITWHQVGGLDLMVSCMVQDADGVIYVGTGDGNNGINYNGLSQQGYDNSFIGTGLYALTNDEFELVKAPTADEWLYINDLAIAGNLLLAATDEGLMCSNDKGHNWTNAVEGKAVSVTAYASQGFVFEGWYNGDTKLSASTTLSGFTMPSANTTLTACFTYNPTTPADPVSSYALGDVNQDRELNVTDVIVLTNYIMNPDPNTPILLYDTNSDGEVNVTDVIRLVNKIMNNQ